MIKRFFQKKPIASQSSKPQPPSDILQLNEANLAWENETINFLNTKGYGIDNNTGKLSNGSHWTTIPELLKYSAAIKIRSTNWTDYHFSPKYATQGIIISTRPDGFLKLEFSNEVRLEIFRKFLNYPNISRSLILDQLLKVSDWLDIVEPASVGMISSEVFFRIDSIIYEQIKPNWLEMMHDILLYGETIFRYSQEGNNYEQRTRSSD